jgi:hypothetical protein
MPFSEKNMGKTINCAQCDTEMDEIRSGIMRNAALAARGLLNLSAEDTRKLETEFLCAACAEKKKATSEPAHFIGRRSLWMVTSEPGGRAILGAVTDQLEPDLDKAAQLLVKHGPWPIPHEIPAEEEFLGLLATLREKAANVVIGVPNA